MKNLSNTDSDLIKEISFLKQKIKELEQSESDLKRAEEELRVRLVEFEKQNNELRRTQAELEGTQANHFDLYGLTPVGFCTVSEQGLILRFTPAAASMLGATQSTLVKQPISRFILKDDQAIYYRHRRQLFETGEPQACELRMVRMDGTIFWAHLAATTAQDVNAAPEYRVVLSDITERKLAEDNFRILADLNDISPVSITVHDLQGNFLYANQKTIDLHGYSKDEFLALNLHDIDVPASVHLIEARIQKIMKVGEAQFEVEHYRKDGTSFPLEVFVKKAKWGRKNVLLSIASDITERMQAEAKLKQQTDAMEASMDGIAILNEDHNYIYVNEAHARIYGYNTSEELIGASWRVLYDEDELQRFDSNIMPELVQKAQWQGEATGKKKDGSTFPQEISLTALDHGGLICIVRDTTSRKQAEETLRKNEDKLKSIFRAAPVGIGVVSERVIMEANDRLCTMTGYKREELIGQSAQIFYPDEKEFNFVGREKHRQIAERGTGAVETRWQCKDGRIIDVLLSSTPINPIDMAGGVTFTALDITERRRVEEALQESETMQRTLLEKLPAGVMIIDPVTRIIENVNNTAAAMFGTQAARIVGHRCHAFLCPAEEDACPVCDRGKEVDNAEREMICADGSRRPVLKSVKRIQIGGQEKLLECFVDITEQKEAVAALMESEERYRIAIEASHDGIAIVQNDIHVYVNQSFLNMFRYNTLNEIIGKNNYCVIHPDDYERVVGYVQARQKGEYAPTRYEFRGIRRDGAPIEVEVSVNTVSYKGEKAILAYLRDITERKLAEAAVRESEAKYRSIFQNAVMGIFRTTPGGRYLSINPAGARMYGYESEEEMMQSITDMAYQIYVHPEDRKRLHELLNISGFVEAFESPHYTKDRSIIWVSINVRVIRDNSGSILYYETTSQDITSRKQAEKAFAKEREKLKTLSDNAPFGMVLIDQEGHFVYINRKFTELFGFDLSDIPDGRTWCRKAYPDAGYRHNVISAWRADLGDTRPGEKNPNIFTVTCKDGTQKIVQFIFSVLVSDDSLMTCEDITELRQLENQLRQAYKMESIGTLAGGIAHDFNNILTALMGYASLIQIKMDRSDPLKVYVDEILSASGKAVDLTQSLLAFSRQQSVTLVPLNMNNTIKTAKKLLGRLLTEDIELRTSLTDDETIIMADKSQMDQILFNLVTNARDAMPKGGILTIETVFATIDTDFIKINGFGEPGEYVQINITDTGMGMDETTQSKIFDPFFTTKEVGKGTGLGLATVYGIVKKHNGYITVESALKQGSTFHVYLPKVTMTVGETEDTIIPVAGGKETILIAEDNAEARRFMREALRQYGYKTIEAIDGEDAIEKFKEQRDIDLIIIDSVMPKKNGREAYEEIHNINPHIKALFTSGYTKDIVLDKGIEEKEFDFIGKPLSLNKLLLKVREALDR